MTELRHDITLDIATAKSCSSAKWRNKKTTWKEVADSLKETERTSETIKQYFSYTKDRQDKIKDVGGFVGGKLLSGTNKIKGKDVTYVEPYGWRRKGFIKHRQLVALDVDFGSIETWLNFRLFDYAGLFYTTHKHTPDEPRLRIVFPLDRPVSPDEYECIARIVASWLDIEVFDDTTYQPTRLMYYPSTAKDGEFLSDVSDGPIMSADKILSELDDWTDVTSWPQSSREKNTKRPSSDQVEDPIYKTGIVGAFCRAFTLEEAIDEFLPEIYTLCEDFGGDRYSYTEGSTSGGLIIYDHKFAYSHHNTDPAGGKLCNAFDLIRLHKFGHLDDKVKEDTAPEKYPSFKAMSEFAGTVKQVKKEVLRERMEKQSAEYDLPESTNIRSHDEENWMYDLEMDAKGDQIKQTIDNIVRIFNNDNYLKGRFAFNQFEHRETVTSPVPWDEEGINYPRPLLDSDDAQLRLYFERFYNITARDKIIDGLTIAVKTNSYHPVRDYLSSCTWDRIERLDTVLIDTLGATDTLYTRAVSRKFFAAAVARIFNPGVKFDSMLTIVGDQGIGKSTFFSRMGGKWFSDSVTTVNDSKAVEGLQGAWLIEMGELSGLRKSEVDAVKHFISKTEDRYRVAYGKRVSYFPRSCVFAGTTNEDDFLRDATGNRRYWIVNCKNGAIELPVFDYLTPDIVAQIWAEAKERLDNGESLHLDAEKEADAREIQDSHLEKDDRLGLIREYVSRLLPETWNDLAPYERRQWLTEELNFDKGKIQRSRVCIMEIWAECLGKNPEDITRRDSMELARAIKAMRDWNPVGPERIKWYGTQKQFEFTGLPKTFGYNILTKIQDKGIIEDLL